MAEPIEIDADPPTGIEVLLQAGFDKETRIPKVILDLVPSASIAVTSLLEKSLPTLLHPSTVNLRPAGSCTTHNPARWTVEEPRQHYHCPAPYNPQPVSSTMGWAFLVFRCRGRGTEGGVEKSSGLGFTSGAERKRV